MFSDRYSSSEIASVTVLRWAITVAVIARIALFAWATVSPIHDQRGEDISPTKVYTGTDSVFYSQSRELYFNQPLADVIREFNRYYLPSNEAVVDLYGRIGHSVAIPRQLNKAGVDYYVSSPLFPALMELFDYSDGNALPLSIFYLLLSAVTTGLWLIWLRSRGLRTLGLMLFAVMPNPMWFMLTVSTDSLFAFLLACYVFFGLRSDQSINVRMFMFTASMALAMALTRPNGMSLVALASVQAMALVLQNTNRTFRLSIIASIALLAVPLTYFLLPHYVVYVQDGLQVSYFGISQAAYVGGLFDMQGVLSTVDKAGSVAALAGAKILYLVGLRPSYAGLEGWRLLARMAAGVVLLPGLFVLFLRGRFWEKALVALYLAPVLSAASQDRYLLPIAPILFFYGATFYSWIFPKRVWPWPRREASTEHH